MFYPVRTTWQHLRKCEVMEGWSLFVSSLSHKALFQMSFHATKMNQSPPSKMNPCPFLLFLLLDRFNALQLQLIMYCLSSTTWAKNVSYGGPHWTHKCLNILSVILHYWILCSSCRFDLSVYNLVVVVHRLKKHIGRALKWVSHLFLAEKTEIQN